MICFISPMIRGSKELCGRKEQLKTITEEYYDLHKRFTNDPDDMELYAKYSDAATRKKELEESVRNADVLVGGMLEMYSGLAESHSGKYDDEIKNLSSLMHYSNKLKRKASKADRAEEKRKNSRVRLAEAYANLGNAHANKKKIKKSYKEYMNALEVYKELASKYPGEFDAQLAAVQKKLDEASAEL